MEKFRRLQQRDAFLLPGNSLPADNAKSHNFRFQISRLFGDYPKST